MTLRLSVNGRDLLSSWVALYGIWILSLGLYLYELTRTLWLPDFYSMPHLDLPKIVGVSEDSLHWFVATMALLCLLYAAAILVASRLRSLRSALMTALMGAVLGFALIAMFPAAAGDVYAYIAEADVVLRYHANPFIYPVSAFPDHPLLPYLDYPGETTHYGPLWLVLAVTLRTLAGPGLLAALIVFKVAALAGLLLVAWLAYLTLRRDNPRGAVRAVVMIAWNPLLLFEFAGNAHNDIFMMCFVVLAFYLQGRGMRKGAIASLVLACLIKYVAIILIPLFLVEDLRRAGPLRQWAAHAAIGGGLTAIAALLVAKLAGIEGTVGILEEMTTWFTTSMGAVAYYNLARSMPASRASDLVSDWTKVVFVTAYVLHCAWVWKKPDNLRGTALAATIAFMLILTVWYQPWYIVWALPIAAIAAGSLPVGLAVGMTAGGFGVHATMGFAWRLWWQTADKADVYARGTLAMWVPVLAGLAIGLAATWFQRWQSARHAAFTESLDEQTLV